MNTLTETASPQITDDAIRQILAQSQGLTLDDFNDEMTLAELDVNSTDVLDIACHLQGQLGINIGCGEFGRLWGGEVPPSGLNPRSRKAGESIQPAELANIRKSTVGDYIAFVREHIPKEAQD